MKKRANEEFFVGIVRNLDQNDYIMIVSIWLIIMVAYLHIIKLLFAISLVKSFDSKHSHLFNLIYLKLGKFFFALRRVLGDEM